MLRHGSYVSVPRTPIVITNAPPLFSLPIFLQSDAVMPIFVLDPIDYCLPNRLIPRRSRTNLFAFTLSPLFVHSFSHFIIMSSLSWKNSLIALATIWLGSSSVQAQTQHFGQDELVELWTVSTNAVGVGNGAFMSPRGDLLAVISNDGLIRALNPSNGTRIWSFPPEVGTTSTSGIFFSSEAAVPYTVHCIQSGAARYVVKKSERLMGRRRLHIGYHKRCALVLVSQSLAHLVAVAVHCYIYVLAQSFYSTIIALNMATGIEVLRTAVIQGNCVGTPVTTADGQYIMTTHNVGGAAGFFSVFDIAAPTEAVLTFSLDGVDQPFGALGYYWNPGAGYFDGGEANTNDVFYWCLDANPAAGNSTSTGQIFAFQMPMTPTELNVTLVGGDRSWQTSLPPIITNQGFSMYWSVSRSQQIAWVGSVGLGREDFSTDGTNVGFQRGDPARASSLAPVTLSSDPLAPFIVGPTASTQIFRMSSDFMEGDGAPTAETGSVLTSRVAISKDDAIVYYGTPSPDGNLVGADAGSLQQLWNISIPAGVLGEIALSLNGDTVFVADAVGTVRAISVAIAPPVTNAPTPSPANQTDAPAVLTFSPAPSSVGGGNGTAPTLSPVAGNDTTASLGPGTAIPTLMDSTTMAPTAEGNGTAPTASAPAAAAPVANATAPTKAPVKAPASSPSAPSAPTAPVKAPAAAPVRVPTAPVGGEGSSANTATVAASLLFGVLGLFV